MIDENVSIPEKPPIKAASPALIILAVILAVILIGGVASGLWYYYDGPCGINKVKAASDQLAKLFTTFSDAEKLGRSTSRIGLAVPIASMQSIKRDLADIEVPVCMAAAKQDMTWLMDNTVNGYLSFASQEADTKVQSYFELAGGNSTNFINDLAEVSKCAPFCAAK